MIATIVAIIGLLAEEQGKGTLFLLAIGPAGGSALYYGLYRYYRNTDKSHSFETETRVDAQPVTGTDRKVDEVHGTRRSRIEGDNVTEHRKRVQRIQ